MIIDLQRFVAAEQPFWTELEGMLHRFDQDPALRLELAELRRFHYLFERAGADLAKVLTFASEPEMQHYLESLVARAYGEVHETREQGGRFNLRKWFFQQFPETFRRHVRAFVFSCLITVAGVALGGAVIIFDPQSKGAILPFSHLLGSPSERVAEEEKVTVDRLAGKKTTFSTSLMTHNTRVSILTLALGSTWGIGTIIMLFYNGVILGAVAVDYILAGQTRFLLGWLLPHGVVEIPAILIAGQAGLVLAGALIGWGRRISLRDRLRAVTSDLATLIGGVGVLLVWAGFIEAFLSQYHEPFVPYTLKIIFGLVELTLLILFLARSGSRAETQP